MQFHRPIFLLVAFVVGALLTALYVHLAASRRRALAQLGASHLLSQLTASVSRAKRRVKAVMVVTGVVLVAIALARPQYGSRWEQAHRRGVDVLFAVDTSKSMLTPDLKPNRLERAKLAVRDLVEKFPGDRVGLVAFAGSAFLETPLTLDHGIFEQSLGGLDTSVIPLGGTDVASAIEVSKRALADDEHKKIMILLTDGEDLSGDAVAAARAAAKEGLTIYTVGVGTPRGELVPLTTKDGKTTYVEDEAGKLVTSKLDEGLLRSVATATGGSYRALGDDGRGLESLYREELASLPRSDLAARSQQVPIERYQWPLGLGLLLLGVEPLINERRRAHKARLAAPSRPARSSWARLVAAGVSALAALLSFVPVASASPQSAEHAYHDGKFAKAQGDYASAAKGAPSDPRLQFNLGAAAYRNGALDDASKAFEAALHTDDTQLQEHAYYDLGDVLYRKGQATLKDGKTDETIGAWKKAISSYESGLRLDTRDADATFNRDFVKRKLAELEKKKQDEQSKNDEQKKEQDKKPQDQKGQGQEKPNDSKSNDAKGSGSASQKDGAKGRGADPKPGDPKANPESKAGSPNGQQPQPSTSAPGAPQPQAGESASKGAATSEPEAPAGPGELSKSDARALLDSLRGDLQMRPSQTPPTTPMVDRAQKDW